MTHIITPHRTTNKTQRDKNFILRGVPENVSRPNLQRVFPKLEVLEASAKNAATFGRRSSSAGRISEPKRSVLRVALPWFSVRGGFRGVRSTNCASSAFHGFGERFAR